jgi:hypothetical protein
MQMNSKKTRCPQCGGSLFEFATYVDDIHPDGDWYEYETEACIDCQHITYQHTNHCGEYGGRGFNDHYDGVRRQIRRYDEKGNFNVLTLDRLYNSVVSDSDGYLPRNEPKLKHPSSVPNQVEVGIGAKIVTANQQIARFLARHPERMLDLTSRKFEELVADILRDLGCDVKLTKATRDGGVDMYADVRHEVGKFLLLVECKRWAPNRPVGIEVVQRLYGIQQATQANKSMVVTTSRFTAPAIREAQRYEHQMELRDYDSLKQWLERYR